MSPLADLLVFLASTLVDHPGAVTVDEESGEQGVVLNLKVGQGDVGIRGGRIAAIGELDPAAAGETVEALGLHVLPGVIDTQVHFREPGLEHTCPQVFAAK